MLKLQKYTKPNSALFKKLYPKYVGTSLWTQCWDDGGRGVESVSSLPKLSLLRILDNETEFIHFLLQDVPNSVKFLTCSLNKASHAFS